MNGRVYDPNLGRFLSVDPVFEFPTNMQSLNPYSYVLNNPLSLTDPTGYVVDKALHPAGNAGGKAVESYTITTTLAGSSSSITVTATKLSNGDYKISTNCTQIAAAVKATFGSNGSSGANDADKTGTGTAQLGGLTQRGTPNSVTTENKRHINAHPGGKQGPTITFNNDVPGGPSTDQPVQSSLASAVEQATKSTGISPNINSTTGGGRNPNDPHAQGRAVDINKLNNIPVSSRAALPLLQRFEHALEKIRAVDQILAPNLDVNIRKSGVTVPITNKKLIREHKNHMHVNVWRKVP